MKLSNLMNFSIQKKEKYYSESVASKLPISTRANHPASQANAASIQYGTTFGQYHIEQLQGMELLIN